MVKRILTLFGVPSGRQMTKRFGLCQGHLDNVKKNKCSNALTFWMRLALDCLEGMPERKRRKIIEKYKK